MIKSVSERIFSFERREAKREMLGLLFWKEKERGKEKRKAKEPKGSRVGFVLFLPSSFSVCPFTREALQLLHNVGILSPTSTPTDDQG